MANFTPNIIKNHLALMLLVGLLAFSGCDIIDGPKKCLECLSESTGKKVLVEDWTGHRCGNCPRGHEAANGLEDIYGDQLIIVSVHASDFAKPKSPKYLPDYRTVSGDSWHEYFIPAYPSASISRREFGGKVAQDIADWGTYIGLIAAETPILSLELTSTFDSISREVTVGSDIEYFQASSSDDFLVLIITQDSIISTQTDYLASPEDIEDYVHRHMFRTCITPGNWGVSLNGGSSITAGATFINSFSITLDGAWDADHCHVVGYVMNGDSKEIHQAEETSVSGSGE